MCTAQCSRKLALWSFVTLKFKLKFEVKFEVQPEPMTKNIEQ